MNENDQKSDLSGYLARLKRRPSFKCVCVCVYMNVCLFMCTSGLLFTAWRLSFLSFPLAAIKPSEQTQPTPQYYNEEAFLAQSFGFIYTCFSLSLLSSTLFSAALAFSIQAPMSSELCQDNPQYLAHVQVYKVRK